MVKQRGSSLRAISFLDVTFRDVSIEQMLRLTPLVTTLTVTGTTFPYIFDRLASDASLLPRMETLVVRPSDQDASNIRPVSPALNAVARVVESRAHILRAVTVEALYEHADKETVDRLRRLHNRGIAIEVNIINVVDSCWGVMLLFLQVIFAFHPLCSMSLDVKNPQEVSSLIANLAYCPTNTLTHSSTFYAHIYLIYLRTKIGVVWIQLSGHLDDFAIAKLPGEEGARIMRRFNALVDKWKSIA
ncbi:hypothetical protein MPER_06650, partial [Moniliophthora perniciosa FA553]